jgi:regulatory protein
VGAGGCRRAGGVATTVADALALAYRYLSRRERTVAETAAHLRQREVDDLTAGEVVQTLLEQGYLDDARFARLYVQDRRELDRWGDLRIRRGLQARGIDSETAAAALCDAGEDSETGEAGGELDRAVALLRSRMPGSPPDRRGRERALGILLRKGYAYELADDAIRAHLGEG